MKLHFFHLMPWPDLPDDFQQKYRSVWVDVPSQLYDPVRGNAVYNDYLDELEYAAEMAFDGICVNEHHSNAYGLMPSPNIMAASLARRTSDAALIVMGNSIALYNPPIRVAEEFAMLDVISGGRLVAGFPVGSSMDTNFAYGQVPVTLREKYQEAHDLIIRAWTDPEVFAWNGKYTQLRYVNPWPRPVQKPHPPIWIPGGGSVETWEWVTERDYLYAYLSYFGYKRARGAMQGFWNEVERQGVEPNPYRAGFLQLVAVAESDADAEAKYARHVEYFYHKCLHVPGPWFSPPGNQDHRSLATSLTNPVRYAENPKGLRYRDFVEKGYVIAGSAATVRDRLREEVIQGLRVGNLMLLPQIGSMPHELALENIDRLGQDVLPALRDVWDDEGWVNHWWPRDLRAPLAAPATAAARA
jgi:alkanesulfonate monooxygenase SsuD/methylene tetrahydromethanopterin reductase-like flavin-dependent oxidoreductase (luciferase family)